MSDSQQIDFTGMTPGDIIAKLDEDNERVKRELREISKRIWRRINPAYSSSFYATTTNRSFSSPKTEDLGVTHDWRYHRKKNDFTEFTEASARQKNLIKKSPTQPPK